MKQVTVKLKYFNEHAVLPWHEGGGELVESIINRDELRKVFGDPEVSRIELTLIERLLISEISCVASEHQLLKMMDNYETEQGKK